MRQNHSLMFVILSYIITLCFCQCPDNCLTCSSGVCTLCNYSYAFTYGTTNCIQCTTLNVTILNNTCYVVPPNCQYQIDPTNTSTLVCTLCNAIYAFTYGTTNCVQCNASTSTILNNTCFSGAQNCQQYQMSSTPGILICTQCIPNYGFNYDVTNCIRCVDSN
jgi:hypothetical protein